MEEPERYVMTLKSGRKAEKDKATSQQWETSGWGTGQTSRKDKLNRERCAPNQKGTGNNPTFSLRGTRGSKEMPAWRSNRVKSNFGVPCIRKTRPPFLL